LTGAGVCALGTGRALEPVFTGANREIEPPQCRAPLRTEPAPILEQAQDDGAFDRWRAIPACGFDNLRHFVTIALLGRTVASVTVLALPAQDRAGLPTGAAAVSSTTGDCNNRDRPRLARPAMRRESAWASADVSTVRAGEVLHWEIGRAHV